MKLQIFAIKKIPKLDSNHTCLAVISLNSALKKDGNYYPQVLLKECKYIEKKVVRYIHDNLSNLLVLLMSLMKNKLEWINVFVTQLGIKDCKLGTLGIYIRYVH